MQLPVQNPSPAFIYWPSDLVITVDVGGASEVDPDSVLPELLGFPVAWKTLPGNSAEIRIYSEGEYTAEGELKYEPNPGNRKIDPMVKYKMEGTAPARRSCEPFTRRRAWFGGLTRRPQACFS